MMKIYLIMIKICHKLFIKKRIYDYFLKLKNIKNYQIKKICSKILKISKRNRLGGGSDTEFIYNLTFNLKTKML